MRVIQAHNKEAELGMHSFEMAMNHLGDMVSRPLPSKPGPKKNLVDCKVQVSFVVLVLVSPAYYMGKHFISPLVSSQEL